MDKQGLTVSEVSAMALNFFVLDVLAVAEDNIGHGSTMDMMRRCFCSVLFDKNYAEVTEDDFQKLDDNLVQFVEDLPEAKAEG